MCFCYSLVVFFSSFVFRPPAGEVCFFSEIFHCDRNLVTEKIDRSGFSRKNFVCPKMGKKGPKLVKIGQKWKIN